MFTPRDNDNDVLPDKPVAAMICTGDALSMVRSARMTGKFPLTWMLATALATEIVLPGFRLACSIAQLRDPTVVPWPSSVARVTR
jgi:hypothetical protein